MQAVFDEIITQNPVYFSDVQRSFPEGHAVGHIQSLEQGDDFIDAKVSIAADPQEKSAVNTMEKASNPVNATLRCNLMRNLTPLSALLLS